MANHVKYAISLTPVAEGSISEGSGNVSVIGSDIGKTLGGSASIDVAHTTLGYGSGTVAYGEAEVSGGSDSTLGSGGYDIVFIKNTGFKYSTATALGDAITAGTNVKVTIGTQEIARIPSGGCIMLNNVPVASIKVRSTDASENIAVEYALIT